MFTRILVPLDGSAFASRAVPYAVFLARALNGSLTLFHASPDRARAGRDAADEDTIDEQQRIAEQLVRAGVPTSVRAATGDTGPAIVQAISALGVDLVVMATHDRGGVGRLVQGNVADFLLHHVQVPILAVSPACSRVWEHGRPLRVLIPLDGSAASEAAITPVLELARWLSVEVLLLRAVEDRFEIDAIGFARSEPASRTDLDAARKELEPIAAPLRAAGYVVAVSAEAGKPDDVIGMVASRDAIDLVAMATRGQGGLGQLLVDGMATVVTAGRVPLHLGSVATASIRQVTVPVLLVSPVSDAHAGEPAGSPTITAAPPGTGPGDEQLGRT